MKIGLIIAAGKQSRFKEQTPKCLAKINGTCILDTTVENLSKYCDKVFVVCSIENESYFEDFDHVSIVSGLGSGDAILRAIEALSLQNKISKNDYAIIQWGDALVSEELYQKLDFDADYCSIPCTFEANPYVQIIPYSDKKIAVKFSKYNDQITPGYHDMCVFGANINLLYNKLCDFYYKFYTSDHYNHVHGQEFEFLDVFNDTDYQGKIIEVDSSLSTKSFNTIEELKNLGGSTDGK